MVNILKSLNSKRFFLIENTNIKIFEDIISQLGNEVLRSNIKVEKNPRALVVSNAAIEWHQDSTEARWMAWYCLHPGTGKNEYTEILPLDQIVGGFSANDSAVFSKIKVKDRKSDGSENPKKLFEGNSLYYCPWLIEKENCSKGKIKKLKKVIGEAEGKYCLGYSQLECGKFAFVAEWYEFIFSGWCCYGDWKKGSGGHEIFIDFPPNMDPAFCLKWGSPKC